MVHSSRVPSLLLFLLFLLPPGVLDVPPGVRGLPFEQSPLGALSLIERGGRHAMLLLHVVSHPGKEGVHLGDVIATPANVEGSTSNFAWAELASGLRVVDRQREIPWTSDRKLHSVRGENRDGRLMRWLRLGPTRAEVVQVTPDPHVAVPDQRDASAGAALLDLPRSRDRSSQPS